MIKILIKEATELSVFDLHNDEKNFLGNPRKKQNLYLR
jgi:hypothetical protein